MIRKDQDPRREGRERASDSGGTSERNQKKYHTLEDVAVLLDVLTEAVVEVVVLAAEHVRNLLPDLPVHASLFGLREVGVCVRVLVCGTKEQTKAEPA